IYIFDDQLYGEYILLVFIIFTTLLYDSNWINLLLFILYLVILPVVDFSSSEAIFQLLRYITFFIVFLSFKRILKEIEGLLTEKHTQTLQLKLDQVEKQKKLVEAELNHKNNELVNLAIQITKKNEFFENLRDDIREVRKNAKENKAELNQIENAIRNNQSLITDREEFELYIKSVSEGFYVRLKNSYPEVTEYDQKLAALIRLGLSSKEISAILNISSKSVDMNRYRLRKKMRLDSNDVLSEILKNI
ncbi:MAG: LuxR C-terminal-related transcriptional regulator, partial [Bacteroidota bacterium]